MPNIKHVGITTPIGTAIIKGNAQGITQMHVCNDENVTSTIPPLLKNCVQEVQAYFKGDLKTFSCNLVPKGTPFQQKVWQALLDIPYGRTISYQELAQQIGDKNAVRAVASANGKNPLWILIPCHRVIAKDGSLAGYAGGVWRKKWLLNHEKGLQQTSLF